MLHRCFRRSHRRDFALRLWTSRGSRVRAGLGFRWRVRRFNSRRRLRRARAFAKFLTRRRRARRSNNRRRARLSRSGRCRSSFRRGSRDRASCRDLLRLQGLQLQCHCSVDREASHPFGLVNPTVAALGFVPFCLCRLQLFHSGARPIFLVGRATGHRAKGDQGN